MSSDFPASSRRPADEASASESTPRRPACDTCRARKIRCDKASPCANCLASRTECTLATVKPREKRTRILLTPQYEKKIDNIDQRLEDVLQLLGAVSSKVSANASPAARFPHSPSSASASAPTLASDKPSMARCEDESDSTLAVHGEMAIEFAQDVAQDHASAEGLRPSLDALRHVVQSLSQSKANSQETYPYATKLGHRLAEVSRLPPIEEVVLLFRTRKASRGHHLSFVFEFVSTQDLSDLCLGVYFSQDYTSTDFVILNAGLLCVLEDAACDTSGTDRDRHLSHASMCRANLENALGNLPLYLPLSRQTIVALLCGIYYALQLSKPLLAATLVSKAVETCQSLGYNHLNSTKASIKAKDGEVDIDHLVFWCVYAADRFLSVRLQKAPSIPDWDVSTQEPSANFNEHVQRGIFQANLWLTVALARLHGQLYEKLLSPRAMKVTPAEARSSAQEVVTGLEEFGDKFAAWRSSKVNQALTKEMELSHVAYEAMRLSLLVVAYRKVPMPPASSKEPFLAASTAREALYTLQKCAQLLTTSQPLKWQTGVMMYAPISFISLFCHAINQRDEADVEILTSFTNSLDMISEETPSLKKMKKLFQELHCLARPLLSVSAKDDPGQMLVGQLGESDCIDPMMWIDDMAGIEDWMRNDLYDEGSQV